MNAKELGADFLLLLVAIAWGCTFLPVQKAIESESVFLFLFYRFSLATVLMALFSVKALKNASKDAVKAGFLLGIILFLGFAFQTFGLKTVYSSSVAFITGLNVVIVPFLVFVIFKKPPLIYSSIGTVVAAFGLYFLTSNGELSFGIGEFYTLICAFMFALQIVLTSYFVKKHDIYVLVVAQFFCVSLLALVSSVIFDGKILPNAWGEDFIFAVFVTAVFATVFAFFVQTAMQRFTTPAKTAIIFTMEPVSAGLLGYFYADEALSSVQIMGAFLILVGVLVAELGGYFNPKSFYKPKP